QDRPGQRLVDAVGDDGDDQRQRVALDDGIAHLVEGDGRTGEDLVGFERVELHDAVILVQRAEILELRRSTRLEVTQEVDFGDGRSVGSKIRVSPGSVAVLVDGSMPCSLVIAVRSRPGSTTRTTSSAEEPKISVKALAPTLWIVMVSPMMPAP